MKAVKSALLAALVFCENRGDGRGWHDDCKFYRQGQMAQPQELNERNRKVKKMRDMRRHNHSKGQLDALFEAERRLMAIDQKDVHACRRLWRTVIERTVDDIRFLRRHRGKGNMKKHEEERLRRIRENPPQEFIRGEWFDQICDYLQVDPLRLRRAITDSETRAA